MSVLRIVCIWLVFSTTLTIHAAQFELPHTQGNNDDSFGESVAIHGNRILVGAPYIDESGSQSGAAYYYAFNGSTWVQEQMIIPSDINDLDFYGSAVALSNNIAAIGAFGADSGSGFRSGVVYLYRHDGATWNQNGRLWDAAGNSQDDFGVAVALTDDYLFIGSPGDDDAGANSGSVFVYHFNGSIWEFVTRFYPGQEGDAFGASVSADGSWLAIGAYGDDDGANESGAVYLYYFNGSTWSFQEKVKPGDPRTGSFFGRSIALDGQQMLVGAPDDNENGISSGSVYVFSYDGSNWSQQEKLYASDSNAYQQYGSSLDISRKYAVVGAPNDSHNGTRAGSAYLLFYNERTWIELLRFTPNGSLPYLQFGYSVALNETFAVAGAPWDKDEANQEGRVYVFDDIASFKPIPVMSVWGVLFVIMGFSILILRGR